MPYLAYEAESGHTGSGLANRVNHLCGDTFFRDVDPTGLKLVTRAGCGRLR